jgi:hypothetical protein
MSKEFEKKLRDIFHAHDLRMEVREREAAAAKQRQLDSIMRMHNHLSKVIMPALRELAVAIQNAGQRASVVETGPIGSPETSTAQVKLTIIPRGLDTADPEELPRLMFQSSQAGIAVTEYACFPGSGGGSTTTQPLAPEELGAEKIEAVVLALARETFNR